MRAGILPVLLALIGLAAHGADPAPALPLPRIGTLREVAALTNEQAAKRFPVQVQGVITYVNDYMGMMFLEDGTAGIYVDYGSALPWFTNGIRVEVTAVTERGRHTPILGQASFRQLGPGQFPEKKPVALADLWAGKHDCAWVTVRAFVRVHSVNATMTRLKLSDANRSIDAWVDGLPAEWLAHLNFAEVEVSGPSSVGVTDDGVIDRISIWVPTTNHLTVLRTSGDVITSLPALSFTEVKNMAANDPNLNRPVRAVGTVAHVSGRHGIKLQDGSDALTVADFAPPAPAIGNRIEAIGWLGGTKGGVKILGARLHDLGTGVLPPPVRISIAEAEQGGHEGNLVTMDGVLRQRVVADGDSTWILEKGGDFFEAALPPGMEDVRNPVAPPGTTVRLTGVLVMGDATPGQPARPGVLLRSAADVEVISSAPWPIQRVLSIIAVLLGLLAAGLLVLAILHVRLKRRTSDLNAARAALEDANRRLEERVRNRTHTLTQTLDALRESEDRFRQLADRIDQIFWMSTADNNQMLYLSPGFERICGIPVEQVYAKPDAWFKLIHPDDQARVFGAALSKPVIKEYEIDYRIIRPDGTVRWVRDRAFPVRDASGQPYRVAGIAEDITERRRAGEELREQHIALTNAMPGIARLDADGIYLHVNEQYARMVACAPAELLGVHFSITVHPEDMPAATRTYEQMLETGKGEAEFRGVRKDRSIFWKHVLLVRIPPDKAANAGHHCFMRDITGRKRNELLLEGQKAVLETIASGAPCAEALAAIARLIETHAEGTRTSIMLVTEDGAHLRSAASPSLPEAFVRAIDNPPIEPPTGACAAAHLRQRVIVPDLAADRRMAAFAEQAASIGLRACASTPILSGDGSALGSIAVYFTTPRGPTPEEEHLTHLAAQLAAIAIEQERIQRAERDARDRYRQIITSAIDAMITFDKDLRIGVFNPAAERLFNCPEREAAGMPLDSFVPERQRALIREHLAQAGCGESRAGLTVPFSGLRRGGGEFPAEASISQTTLHGRELYTAIVRDLTEAQKSEQTRSQLESRLRQAQKMEAIGTLAGGIAHDFNNILGAVMLNIELARGDVPSDHPAQEYLAALKSSSIRARDLVRQILAFSRRQEQHRSVLRLERVVADAMKLIRAALPPNIVISLRLTSDGPSVIADPTQLHQVLANLSANAAHAMREGGGQLEIVQQIVLVSREQADASPDLQPGGYVRLSVSDTGSGMGPEIIERIFDPFFTTRALGEGTGLGLAVVHGIMKDHDGAILVESAPGQGSRFHLYFPATEAPEPPACGAQHPIPRGQGERVLVVDDEEALLKVSQRTLERLGYSVTAFTSPTVALDAFRSGSGLFDLVITDLAMPGMSGIDLSRKLKSFRPDCPVIITTGYTTSLDPQGIRNLGLAGLIFKPATPAAIGEMVHHVLAARRSTRLP